jgi:long-chain acyl-CoA synthetase
MLTLSEVIAEKARALGAKPCIVLPEGEVALTYQELDKQASHFAGFLQKQGCPRAGHVLIANHNTPEFFVALVGAMRAGMVAIPVDSNLAISELRNIVEHADPYAIVVSATSAGKMSEISGGRTCILMAEDALPGMQHFKASALDAEPEMLVQNIDANEMGLILYTSGTTGMPKGVMHSHAGLAKKLNTIKEWFSFDDSFRSLCLLPTHFGHGLICNCLATLNYGGTLVLCRPFDLDLVQRLWGYVEKNQINTFSTVPTIVRLLLRVAERSGPIKPPSLKFVTCASAPLRPEDAEAFEQKFGVPLLNCYGITETTSWTAFSPRDENRDRASVGTMSGCEIRTIDENGNPQPTNSPGELQIRGPSVMLGYYKNPDLTAQTIKDGWFSTGDHGKVDEHGRVFLLGRIKELIIRAGLNVYPSDVDAILLTHPEIEEAYSVGLEDAVLGEKVGAAVVLKAGSQASEQDIIAHCRGLLASYKCPEKITFVEAIPKTSRGKVNRSNLRPLFAAQA